jgi:hypothetical protein
VTEKQRDPADDSGVRRAAAQDARIAYDALDRLARSMPTDTPEPRDHHVRARQVQRIANFLACMALIPLLVMFLPLQVNWSGHATLLMYVSLACAIGAALCTGAAVALRRTRLRERREAIKAKRAGLCTCNYPRPPGMLKCPECGGDMVMK